MLVTLVPLFLAAFVAVDVSDWKYGPEVIYNVTVDTASNTTDIRLDTQVFNMTTQLKCRPKSNLILNCHFDNPKTNVTLYEPQDNSSARKETHGFLDLKMNDTFELKFNRDGLEEMVVASSIDRSTLDMIRTIVFQLNIGTDLSTQSAKNFEVMENSSVGKCRTNYVLRTNRANKNAVEDKKMKPYEIVILPGMRPPPTEIGEIQKIRHIDDCPYEINYPFGSPKRARDEATYIKYVPSSSMTRFNIASKGFTSFTENEVHLDHITEGARITMTERFSLSFDKIVPARGPLPKIVDPVTTSIFPTRAINSNED